jgi:WD40 repeat protein
MAETVLTTVQDGTPARNVRHGFTQLAFSPDGRRLAAIDVDLACEIWEDHQVVRWSDFAGDDLKSRPVQRARRVSFDGDDVIVAAVGERVLRQELGSEGRRWERRLHRTFAFLVNPPHDAVATSDGRVVGSFESGSIAIWDQDGNPLHRWREDESPRSMEMLSDHVLLGTDSFRLLRFDLNERRKTSHVGLPERGMNLRLSHRHGVVGIRGIQNLLLFSVEGDELIGQIPMGRGLPRFEFHPTEPALFVLATHAVYLLDFSGKHLARFDVPDATALNLAVHPTGRSVVVGCADRTLRWFSV